MQLLPYIMVLLAAVLWGTTGTTQTFLTGDISPVAIACVRSALGGGVLLLLVFFMKKLNLRTWCWKWSLLAALTIALFQVCFFTSVRLTGVAIGTVVTIGSSPVFAGVLEWILWKVRPTHIWLMSTACAIIGCALLFVNSGEAVVNPMGVLVALCAGFLFALYTNVSKKLTEQAETLPAVAMTFSLCALFLSPVAVMDGLTWVADSQNFVPIVYMGMMTTSVAYLLYLAGLRLINSSAAVTLSLGEPLTAALLGVFLLGEYLTWTSWGGVALIFSSIVVLTMKNKPSIS